jgi:uncharacterized protein (TIGR02145 family)/uncharacterized repeat protein (TIGR02543 family)
MKTTVFKAAAVAAFVVAAGATAQETAYVPFVVNADATVTARQDETVVSISVKANEESVLILPHGVTSVWNTGGTHGRLNAPLITGSRGNITLRLPPQSYQNAEISIYSVNGRQILRGKASATETASGISRRNVAPGAYLLSVKGTNGSAVTTRLTHGGGDMNIIVAFGTENVSPERKLGKKNTAEDGNWDITVSADGYIAQTYPLRAVIGINNRQTINLDPVSQSTTYTLTIAATAGGTVSPSVGVYTYEAGDFVTVTANANSGYTFNGWSGAYTSASATVNITMDGNKTLTANFQQNDTPQPTTYTLTIAAWPGGSVSLSVGAHTFDVYVAGCHPVLHEPCEVGTYEAGTLVTVTATANSGYTFNGWSGASTSASATVNITMDGNKTLTANFQSDIPTPTITTFVDSRDGKTYKKVAIGTQSWMAENLNYNASDSKCHNNITDSCAKYGRLYDWSTAMGISTSYNTTKWNGSDVKRQGVCPAGWHIPNDAEWTTLMDFVGGAATAGTKLKSSTGWSYRSYAPVGTDQYGFTALPGGSGSLTGSFVPTGAYGDWWSATERNADYGWADYAWFRQMIYDAEIVNRDSYPKKALFSVRCVED